MHGILNINKPAGPTSHDVVAKIRRLLHEKKVGHAGTLDPPAMGVLVVAVGKATRILEYLVGSDKEYQAELTLGRTTHTQDATGVELTLTDASHVTRQMVEEVIPRFTGPVMQIPPMVSAVKHKGKRLYELARKDIEVERQPREVTVHELEMTSFIPGEHPVIGLRVVCSSGTYIRTICADMGAALDVGGYMQSLVRTRVGRFELKDSIELDKLEILAQEGRVEELMISMDQALSQIPQVTVDSDVEKLVVNGVPFPTSFKGPEGAVIRVDSKAGELLAIGRLSDGMIKPEKVFMEASS